MFITILTVHMKNGHICYTVKPLYTVPLCIVLLQVSYIFSGPHESPTQTMYNYTECSIPEVSRYHISHPELLILTHNIP